MCLVKDKQTRSVSCKQLLKLIDLIFLQTPGKKLTPASVIGQLLIFNFSKWGIKREIVSKEKSVIAGQSSIYNPVATNNYSGGKRFSLWYADQFFLAYKYNRNTQSISQHYRP